MRILICFSFPLCDQRDCWSIQNIFQALTPRCLVAPGFPVSNKPRCLCECTNVTHNHAQVNLCASQSSGGILLVMAGGCPGFRLINIPVYSGSHNMLTLGVYLWQRKSWKFHPVRNSCITLPLVLLSGLWQRTLQWSNEAVGVREAHTSSSLCSAVLHTLGWPHTHKLMPSQTQ